MIEAVRLVIWDLDGTFWKGTVTEGGMEEYFQEHHDIVIELARRGIISSICSKNDPATIIPLLKERDIFDYFVFPSISWAPKGQRIAGIIEAAQLRAPTVMFIDDNPNNRAEAAAAVPGLQVESELFIREMLDDLRFKGKDDRNLTRLSQYKLLAQKSSERDATDGGDEQFLRNSDIRVCIEYDIENNIDRVVELINRTNQLNYTKLRLDENPEAARATLRKQLDIFHAHAGLIRVADRYGDYGYVGFFLTYSDRAKVTEGAAYVRLLHFCFSCRTLGMYIEQWVYEYLGRPELRVVGDVLTDLSIPRHIDWVKRVAAIDAELHLQEMPQVAPRIILYGGCEAQVVGAYLKAFTQDLVVFGNYAANGLFRRITNAQTLLEMSDHVRDDYAAEAEALGLPGQLEMIDIFAGAPEGTLFVFNLSRDGFPEMLLRHKTKGWTLVLEPRHLSPNHERSKVFASEVRLLRHLDTNTNRYTPDQRDHIIKVGAHIRENYKIAAPWTEAALSALMEELIGRIPKGSKLVFIVNHSEERPKFPDRGVAPVAFLQKYHRFVSDLTRKFDYVGIAMVSNVIKSVDDMMAGDHYAREVYSRLANLVVDVAESLVGRSDSPHASQPGAADASAIATRAGQSNLHETPVPVRNIVRAAAAFVFNLAWTGRRTSGAPPK